MINVEESADGREHRTVQDPPIASTLFQSSGLVTWLWLVVRVWLGWQWISLGWSTLSQPPVWPAVAHLVLGAALLGGAFVGVAATAGLIESVLALSPNDAPDVNPPQLIAAALLILAWKNAGYLGIDRYLLRLFGAPWSTADVPHVSGTARAAAGPRKQR
jgi:thiosulfate dehydrogenase (quinone) large subunit